MHARRGRGRRGRALTSRQQASDPHERSCSEEDPCASPGRFASPRPWAMPGRRAGSGGAVHVGFAPGADVRGPSHGAAAVGLCVVKIASCKDAESIVLLLVPGPPPVTVSAFRSVRRGRS